MPIPAWPRHTFVLALLLGVACGARAEPALDEDARVTCARALEEVRWSQRIWPADNPEPKPALATTLSDDMIRARVRDAHRMEALLAARYGTHVDAEMLQAEMDRIATRTQAPDQLENLFEALGHSPAAIAECLVRPELVRRRLESAWRWDARLHAHVKAQALAALANAGDKHPNGATETVFTLKRESLGGTRIDPADRVLSDTDWTREHERLNAAARYSDGTVLLREVDNGFIHETLLGADDETLHVRVRHWPKGPFENWWRNASDPISAQIPRIDHAALHLPSRTKTTAPAENEQWRVESMPEQRKGHFALWTGNEMIVWGGYSGGTYTTIRGMLRDGGRYRPATDTWEPLATPPQADAPAVWTGTEMILWGSGTGGRYDPETDSWQPIATTNAPTPRSSHSIVWTGEEIIVWGGFSDDNQSTLGTGASYDPASNTWAEIAAAPAGRERALHQAIWSGSQMLIVGGWTEATGIGDRYDPGMNQWSPMDNTGAPPNPANCKAAWTGDRMLVWDGTQGRSYDPGTDTWQSISAFPTTPLWDFTINWSGTHLLLWGAKQQDDALVSVGMQYDPEADAWQAFSTAGAPSTRISHSAVWTGSELIVWGGAGGNTEDFPGLNTGARYNPTTDTWVATNTPGITDPRFNHTAVWTGTEMLVWGGRNGASYLDDGGRYEPATDLWTPLSQTNAPSARDGHTAIWTGSEMIVYGGDGYLVNPTLQVGGRYAPGTDIWTPLEAIEPVGRRGHVMVWTGADVLVWGGDSSMGDLSSAGLRFHPETSAWSTLATEGEPIWGIEATGVWTGQELVVLGYGAVSGGGVGARGGRYDPATDVWQPMSEVGAPSQRASTTSIWTGSEMIVWGGGDRFILVHGKNTGGRYSPSTDTWTVTSATRPPIERHAHTAVWTGDEMIVWGGSDDSNVPQIPTATGGRYLPDADFWAPTTLHRAPPARSGHTAVWTGSRMLVWGGRFTGGIGIYTPGRVKSPDLFADDFEPTNTE